MQWEVSLEVLLHYRMFVAHLETIFIKFNKKTDPSILDSKEIIQSILKKENITLFNWFVLHVYKFPLKALYHDMKNSLILHVSLPKNILWTKWSLQRMGLLHHADEILEQAMNQY